MKHVLLLAAILGASLLGGCGQKGQDSAEMAREANEAMIDSGTTAVQAEDKDDKEDETDHMVQAAEGGMFEVEASQLALARSANPEIKKIAQMMVDHHSKANDELKQLAGSKNVALPQALGTGMMGKLNNLKEKDAKDFDMAYLEAMEEAHEKDVKLFREASTDSEDPEFKAFAAKTLPIIEQHLAMVGKREDRADGSMGASNR